MNKRLLAGVLVAAVAVACVSVGAAQVADKGLTPKSLYSFLYQVLTTVSDTNSYIKSSDTGLPKVVSELGTGGTIYSALNGWFGSGGTYASTAAVDADAGRVSDTALSKTVSGKGLYTIDLDGTLVAYTTTKGTLTVEATWDGTHYKTLYSVETPTSGTTSVSYHDQVVAAGIKITYTDGDGDGDTFDWGYCLIKATQ
ncbi:MAG: hypothetical protein OD814_001817 [Candidatus Alkanophagales archaeon MCA70_species_1]|nr:hypothetical protein [Candidatus Alkanophaga volatiphilum]